MSRGIKDGHLTLTKRKPCLFRKDGDATLPLLIIVIKKSIALIHPALLPDAAGQIQEGFR